MSKELRQAWWCDHCRARGEEPYLPAEYGADVFERIVAEHAKISEACAERRGDTGIVLALHTGAIRVVRS